MKVLVTGGTGYLGRAVVSALAARGHDLVIFARRATGSGLPGTAVDGDIRDRAALERAAAGCDAISHSAALVSIWRRRHEDFDEVNVGGLRNVLDAQLLSQEMPVPAPPLQVAVPFRRGAPGVVHITELASRITAQPATNVGALEGPGMHSAELALEMLRFPFRQVFGDPSLGTDGGSPLVFDELFRPEVGITAIREWTVSQ